MNYSNCAYLNKWIFLSCLSFVLFSTDVFGQSNFDRGAFVPGGTGIYSSVFNGEMKFGIDKVTEYYHPSSGSFCLISEIGVAFSKNEDPFTGKARDVYRDYFSQYGSSRTYDGANGYSNTDYTNIFIETTANYPSGDYYPHIYFYCSDNSIGGAFTFPKRELDNRVETSLLESAAGSMEIYTILFFLLLIVLFCYRNMRARGLV